MTRANEIRMISEAAAITIGPDVVLRSCEKRYVGMIGSGPMRKNAMANSLNDATTQVMKAATSDGVMIGRGALGNPFVFEEVRCALEGKAYKPPTVRERRETALRHAQAAIDEKGAHAMIELRKHLAFYVRGMQDAAKLRARINTCQTLEELRQIWA